MSKSKNIYGFWHITVMGSKWQEIVRDQYRTLCDSGLLTVSKKVYACVVGGDGTEDFSHLKGVTILGRHPNLLVSELFTLRFLKKFCKDDGLTSIMGAASLFFHPELLSFTDSDIDCYVWYIHTKGVSHAGRPNYPNVWDWRKCIEYFLVERWEDCVKALDEGFDICGVGWSWVDSNGNPVNKNPNINRFKFFPNPHFSGNFWWSTSHHINRLGNDLVAHGNRFNAETFIGGAPTVYVSGGPPPNTHYQTSVKNNIPESGIRVKNRHSSLLDGYRLKYPRSNYTSDKPLRSPIMELTHQDILLKLIEANKYNSYLEISTDNIMDRFNSIPCDKKIRVDNSLNDQLYTFDIISNEFFSQNRDTFDLIFVDGLHTAKQAERDILNSLDILNTDGTVVVHDTNPPNITVAAENNPGGAWCGTVWKAIFKLRKTRPDLTIKTYPDDYGVTLITKKTAKLLTDILTIDTEYYSFDTLNSHREQILNFIPENERL